MSPEQAQGLKSVDHRSDLWSLGVVVFECLTGKRPFTAPALGPLIAKIVGGPLPVPSEVAPYASIPPEIDAWMRRTLARDPGERFASARDLADAFLLAAGAAPAASPPGEAWPVLATSPPVTPTVSSHADERAPPPTVDHEAPHAQPTVAGAPPPLDFYPALLEISRLLLREDGGDGTAEVLLRRVVELTGADRGFIVVRDGDADEQRFEVAFNPGEPDPRGAGLQQEPGPPRHSGSSGNPLGRRRG
jgi:hypothetical protein